MPSDRSMISSSSIESMVHAADAREPGGSKVTVPERPVYSEELDRNVGLLDRLARTNGAVRFSKAVARDESGKPRWTYQPGETVTFRFEYEVFTRFRAWPSRSVFTSRPMMSSASLSSSRTFSSC